MKTYILKWNPSISDVSMEDIKGEIESLRIDMDYTLRWSVYDWEHLEPGDRFFFLRVGRGKTGIMGSGWFISSAFEDDSWRKDGTKCHYAIQMCDVMIHPQGHNILTTKELQAVLPDVDWKGGHSGVVITEKQAQILDSTWKTFLHNNAAMFTKDEWFVHNSLVNRAYCIALVAHRGQVDKAGNDYFKSHILDVFERCSGWDDDENPFQEVALLHDIIEDTPWTIERLREEGFSEKVLSALDCITKREGESYDNFIGRILTNPLASYVKACDLLSNMDVTRLNEITDEDIKRLRKYHAAYKRIRAYQDKDTMTSYRFL